MFKMQDALMLLATVSSILVGVSLPEYGVPFQPYPMYCMMALLFFNFLSIRLGAIVQAMRASVFNTCYFVFLKLILLPLIVFVSFHWFFPKYALAALLLSGVSTGVASPFFANLVHANISLVLAMVVISSILVPFTLPAMVQLLVGKDLQISFVAMTRLLSLVIFIPLSLAEIVNRLTPSLARKFSKARYPISIICFVITNLGIFSKYAGFLREEPSTVVVALVVSLTLAVIYFAAGILFSHGQLLEDRLSIIISFGIMNNVLVLVFSSEFFGALEPTVAAIYTVPFFFLIVPLRLYQNWGARPGMRTHSLLKK